MRDEVKNIFSRLDLKVENRNKKNISLGKLAKMIYTKYQRHRKRRSMFNYVPKFIQYRDEVNNSKVSKVEKQNNIF